MPDLCYESMFYEFRVWAISHIIFCTYSKRPLKGGRCKVCGLCICFALSNYSSENYVPREIGFYVMNVLPDELAAVKSKP